MIALAAAALLLAGPEVVLREGRIVVEGAAAGEVSVYAGGGDVPAMLGATSVEGGSLVFRPRFPVAPGLALRVVVRLPGGAVVERRFSAAAEGVNAEARVEQVYPTSGLLPSNQLKFYIHFSAPMRAGEAWKHLRLLDARDAAIDLPFLEIDEELWDRDYRRLTVLFDPGRIKRGVLPLEEVGPAIIEGGRYTLEVDREWRDARGAPLREGFRKTFRVGPSERRAVAPASWRLALPRPATREALTIDFLQPMDHALALRMIEVAGVAGEASVEAQETRWRFVPREPWAAGEYRLRIDSRLEDLAGNKVGRPFDVDTFERVTRRVVPETVERPFRIGRP